MSAQDVVMFAEKIAGDEALQNQIKSLTPGDSSSLLNIASSMGFTFTAEELKTVAARAAELSEEQLDQVAGGIVVVNSKPVGNANPILIGLLLPAIQPPGGIIAPSDAHK